MATAFIAKNPFCSGRCARLNEQPRSDRTQSCKARRYPDHSAVAAQEGLGDGMLNYWVGIVTGCKLRPGGINLSTNIRAQGQLRKVLIQRMVENRDQSDTESGHCKQRGQTGDCVVDP